MGWYYCFKTKEDLVADLVSAGGGNHETLASSVRGNKLWVVKATGDGKKYIGLYLMSGDGQNPWKWGYKPMDESMHPYYYDVPLKFLDMAPVANQGWRDAVKAQAADKVAKAKYMKALKVGDQVNLQHSTIPYLVVTRTTPLVGQYYDKAYRIPTKMIKLPEAA